MFIDGDLADAADGATLKISRRDTVPWHRAAIYCAAIRLSLSLEGP